MGKDKQAAQAIYDRAVAAMEGKEFDLVCIDYRDGLADDQIAMLLAGDELDLIGNPEFDDWLSAQQYEGAMNVIEVDLGLDDDERERLERHDLIEQLRFEVYDHDGSNPVRDLMGHTGHKLFRYSLDWSYDGETWGLSEQEVNDVAAEIAEAACLDLTDPKVKDAVVEMIANASYGGKLYVMLYTDVEQAVALNAAARTDDDGKPIDEQQGTVTFAEGAYLIMLDHWNGSGHDVKMPVPVTVPWFPGRVSLDSQGPGYGWDQIAGVVTHAYGVDFTITTKQQEG